MVAKKHTALVPVSDRFYAVAVILHYLLSVTAPKSTWHERLGSLMAAHPVADPRVMGFPPAWRSEPFWGFEREDYII